MSSIAKRTPSELDTQFCKVDLTDPATIDTFVGAMLTSGWSLYILVNAAGIMAPPLGRDKSRV
jgi:NAD(P)-dependent dehydrogenase (short-subunit alcohol dehydrogenase family)